MPTRTRLAITATALAAACALFIATPGAIATQGQPVLAGAQNTEDFETLIVNTAQVSLSNCLAVNQPQHDGGLIACGWAGVIGLGTNYGVWGTGPVAVRGFGVATGLHGSVSAQAGTGVRGEGGSQGVYGSGKDQGVLGTATASGTGNGVEGWSTTGNGVLGQNFGSTGVGVHGKTGGTGSAVFGEATGDGVGVYATSKTAPAVKGIGGPTGVYGSGNSDGVEGVSHTGDGVLGRNTGPTGIGVHGLTGGTGSAVFGQATTNGVGINGTSATGLGVLAASTSGTALQVNGKAKFIRSGMATVSAGNASTTVSLVGVTTGSMVVATAQQNGSVFVKAAVPAGGSFKIFLTGNAPSGGLKVAYFVLN